VFLRSVRPIQLPFRVFMVCRIFLSFLTVCHTSFLIRSVQLIFFFLLRHCISELARYLWSAFRSVQVSVPYTPNAVFY
jgi:hypothetical protein